MTTAFAFPVTKVLESKLKSTDFNHLPFGKYFSDYMLEADYKNGEWTDIEIKPFQPISFLPSMAALHYGQAIFEGIKAYKHVGNQAESDWLSLTSSLGLCKEIVQLIPLLWTQRSYKDAMRHLMIDQK